MGDTRVLCTASWDDKPPPHRKGTGLGWVTGEYSMLPRATQQRTAREARQGRVDGRTQEIQRLVGRALRAAVDMSAMGERTVIVDCDVIQADGGTRTAAITGGYVALHLAFQHMLRIRAVAAVPLVDPVAAVSCGLVDGAAMLDLDYAKDSRAAADANFVLTGA